MRSPHSTRYALALFQLLAHLRRHQSHLRRLPSLHLLPLLYKLEIRGKINWTAIYCYNLLNQKFDSFIHNFTLTYVHTESFYSRLRPLSLDFRPFSNISALSYTFRPNSDNFRSPASLSATDFFGILFSDTVTYRKLSSSFIPLPSSQFAYTCPIPL